MSRTKPELTPPALGHVLPVADALQVTGPQALVRLAQTVAAVVKFPGQPVPESFIRRLDEAVAAVEAESLAPHLVGELLRTEDDPRLGELAKDVAALREQRAKDDPLWAELASENAAMRGRLEALEALLAKDGPVAEKLQELNRRVVDLTPAPKH